MLYEQRCREVRDTFNASCEENQMTLPDDHCPRCGDGKLNGGEACDDGNAVKGDGCEPDCTLSGILRLPGGG